MTASVPNLPGSGPQGIRPRKTFADYAATALCPGLIMLMVGSLVFFLVQITYAGSHASRLHWTLFWFVLAMVLVSRIAIEKGRESAGLYGIALAAATAFMLYQYVGNHLAVWCLLGLIWWATDKLTWDSTVIDDDQDASGEGLLQAARLNPARREESPVAQSESAPGHSADSSRITNTRTPASKSRRRRESRGRAAPSRQPHAPGRWVIYFSLGALPAFGLGQGLIPAQDEVARQHAFTWLVVYVGAALGLLLMTSFLGLRRYLRQRHLEMPTAMSVDWMSTGMAIGLAILAVCILLPRPQAHWSFTAMIDRLGDRSSNHDETRAARIRPREFGTSESRRAEFRSSPTAHPPLANRPTNTTEAKTEQNDTQKSTGSKRQSSASAQESSADRSNAQSRSPRSSPSLPHFQVPVRLLKILFYAALVLVALWWAFRQRETLLRALQEFWESLRDFWARLFAHRPATAAQSKAELSKAASSQRPFSAFANPFAANQDQSMTSSELIVRSFHGLEAWAEEQQCGRRPDQTPFEFAESLGDQVPDLAVEARQVARLYAQVAYAHSSSLPACRETLAALWIKMTTLGRATPRG